MKNTIRKIAAALMALAIVAGSICVAFADGDLLIAPNPTTTTMPEEPTVSDPISSEDVVSKTDFANNVFAAGSDLEVKKGNFFGGFGAGKDIEIENSNFDDVLMLAGQYITIKESQVQSSAFLAGSDIKLETVYVYGNLFVAGMSVDMNSNVNAKAVYAGGKGISFNGVSDTVNISGKTVVLGGTIFGDANIYAEEVEILSSTTVYGKLNVTAKTEPTIPDGATVGTYNFTKIEESDANAVKEVVESKAQNLLGNRIRTILSLCLSMAVAALIVCWLKPFFIDNSIVLLKTQTVRIFVTGLICFLAIPFACLIVFTTIVGIPIALGVMALYALTMIFSVVFAGCAVGRMLLKKLNPVLASIIGVVVLELIEQIPYLGTLVVLASIFFSLGVIAQLLYKTRQPLSTTN